MEKTIITEFRPHHSLARALWQIELTGEKAYLHRGTYVDVLVWGWKKIVYFKTKDYPLSNGVLFRMVNGNIKKYLQKHKRLKASPELPANEWITDEQISRIRRPITGTDISHAYWQIAFNEGIINENTFVKGMVNPDKGLKLATLANLSSTKKFVVIRNGKETKKHVTVRSNDKRASTVYNNIRYKCYKVMMELAALLKKDFIGYNVDCIYYVDSKQNRKLVYDYLDELGFEYSQIKVKKPKK